MANPEIFVCSSEQCGEMGAADGMYNIPCSVATITREELKKKVLCETCANAYVRHERTVNGRPRASVFRLSDTLRLVDKFAPDGTYLRWYLDGTDERTQTAPRENFEQGYLDWYLRRNATKP